MRSAHLGSDPRYSSLLKNLPTNLRYFCAVYDYVEKVGLSKGYSNPKRKLGVTTHFSEIKICKEIAIYYFYFKTFLKLWLLNYL